MSAEVLGLPAIRRRACVWILVLIAVLVLSLAAGIMIGSVPIAPAGTLEALRTRIAGAGAADPSTTAIVWAVRGPRVVLGACVGAGLAVCGMALQGMVRNVLADPYLLGINSGASTGAAAAILLGVGTGAAPDTVLRPDLIERVYGIGTRRVDFDGRMQLAFAPLPATSEVQRTSE